MAIEDLRKDIEASVFRIAPERETELRTFFRDRRPQFLWGNRPRSLPKVNPQDAVIYLDWPGLTLLWAAAFQYWVLYNEHSNAHADETFRLFGSERRVTAIATFEWALRNFSDPKVSRPDGLPTPSATSPYASDKHVANELFLAAVAWILLHEIAHLQLNHTYVTAIPREEETRADADALSWILDHEHDKPRRTKRILGVCVAILLITALDLDRGSFMDTTHPRAFDRMFALLEQATLEDDHVAFAFCTTMIRVELAKLQLPIPPGNSASWREICYEHLAALHELNKA